MSYSKILYDIEMVEEVDCQFIINITIDYVIKGFTANTAEMIRRIFGKEIKAGDSVLELIDPDDEPLLKEYVDLVFMAILLKTCCSATASIMKIIGSSYTSTLFMKKLTE
jgi:hypothetical protein